MGEQLPLAALVSDILTICRKQKRLMTSAESELIYEYTIEELHNRRVKLQPKEEDQ